MTLAHASRPTSSTSLQRRSPRNREPLSTISHMMPLSDMAHQRAQIEHQRLHGSTRMTCAPAAPSFITAALRRNLSIMTQQPVGARGIDRSAACRQPPARDPPPPRTGGARLPSPAGGRSHRIIHQHQSRSRPDRVHVARATGGRRSSPASPVIADCAFTAAPILSSADPATTGSPWPLRVFGGMPGIIISRLPTAEANIDRDPGGAKFGMALPGHFRIGVFNRRHHARNT